MNSFPDSRAGTGGPMQAPADNLSDGAENDAPDPLAPALHRSAVLAAARVLYAEGCSIIPIVPDGSKRPPWPWKKHQTERADLAQVEQWFANRNYGIATVCGRISGHLEMLELEGDAVPAGVSRR